MGLCVRQEGITAELSAGGLQGLEQLWSPGVSCMPAICGKDLGSGSCFIPAGAIVPFPSSVVVSKARCE